MGETLELFSDEAASDLPEGMILRRGFADADEQKRLVAALQKVFSEAPPVPNRTKGGVTSAAMTNCGAAGWWSDKKGYRYTRENPVTGTPWPSLPESFHELVQRVVRDSPWPAFVPDACLINFYGPGAKMGLHQDRDERDFSQPIVTASLGDSADWLLGGFTRAEKPLRFTIASGDMLIMGGASRMRFHGVRKIHAGTSPIAGLVGRYSLTFRKAL